MKLPLHAERLVWLAVCAFAFCVVGVAAWIHGALWESAERSAAQQVQAVARAAARDLNRILLELDLMLAGLETSGEVHRAGTHDSDPDNLAPILRTIIDQRLFVQDIALLGADSKLQAAAREATARVGLDLPPDLVDEVLSMPTPQLVVGVPRTDFGTGERVLHVARALGMPGPNRLAAVATIPIANLAALVTPTATIAGLWVTVEDRHGVLLASAPAHDAQLGRRAAWPAPAMEPAGDVYKAAGRLDKIPSLALSRPTLYASIRVTAGVSEATVLAGVAGERWATVLVAAAFLALTAGLGGVVQASLARVSTASADAQAARLTLEEALATVEEGFLLWGPDDRVRTWNARYLDLFPHLVPVIAVGAGLREVAEAGARALLPDAGEDERQAWIAERGRRHRAEGVAFEQHLPGGRIVSGTERRTANGGVVAIYRDVTRERSAAAELERARRAAEAANEAKTRFLATMSHEIRTPLNGVLGMNSLLLNTPLDARQRRYAETIRSSGEVLLAIINDVLDMSRLEAGRTSLELAPFDPAALVDEVVGLLVPPACDKHIALEVENDPALPARLQGDAGRIRQILFNLVGNAVKFTERGRVQVHARVRARSDELVDLVLSVSDTGIGIPEEAIPTLFDRFTQADSGVTRHFGGSGLGLAISRELVELMDGRIEVSSRVAEGSRFTVELPLRVVAHAVTPERPAATVAAEPPGSPSCPPPLRVLLAEDNLVNQLLMTTMLEQLGHACDVVADGREALRQVQQVHYDLVLMDIQMPYMDGIAATLAIRELPGDVGSVPIVAVTANVLAEQRAAYRTAGMNGLVAKPVELKHLVAAIAEAVDPAGARARANQTGATLS